MSKQPQQPAATGEQGDERPAAHGRPHATPEATNRHFWNVGFTLAEFQQVDLMVETSGRSFEEAEREALRQHDELYRQWPGPVEIKSIEYLGER